MGFGEVYGVALLKEVYSVYFRNMCWTARDLVDHVTSMLISGFGSPMQPILISTSKQATLVHGILYTIMSACIRVWAVWSYW